MSLLRYGEKLLYMYTSTHTVQVAGGGGATVANHRLEADATRQKLQQAEELRMIGIGHSTMRLRRHSDKEQGPGAKCSHKLYSVR